MNFEAAIFLMLTSTFHAIAEWRGHLWEYLGRLTGARIAANAGPVAGPVFYVLSALVVQVTAIYWAFWGREMPSEVWLQIIIGLRAGDAIFTHISPANKLSPNPGLNTAAIFLCEAGAIAFFTGLPNPLWILVGATPFAVLQPLLKWTENNQKSWE